MHDDIQGKKRNNLEQQAIFKEINKQDDWIIEGTLRKNLYNLLDESSEIVYIDIPLRIRKRRILKRFIMQKLGIQKCNYKPTLEMLKKMYIWTYEFENTKKDFDKMLSKYQNKLIILRTLEEINHYEVKKTFKR